MLFFFSCSGSVLGTAQCSLHSTHSSCCQTRDSLEEILLEKSSCGHRPPNLSFLTMNLKTNARLNPKYVSSWHNEEISTWIYFFLAKLQEILEFSWSNVLTTNAHFFLNFFLHFFVLPQLLNAPVWTITYKINPKCL